MFWIKILNNKSKEESIIEFNSKEDAKLFRDYHIKFDAWGKKESWIAEKNLSPLHRKLVVDEKEEYILTSKKQAILMKYYKISPEFSYVSDNLGTIETELHWDMMREKRDKALLKTDRTMLPDFPLKTKERGLYREYREYLRQLPLNYNDDSIINFSIMSFDEWREFFKK